MCNDNEKIFCCTKLYRLIESYNKEDFSNTQTQLIVPVLCRLVCPEDCNVVAFDPNIESQYVTIVVDNCEDCFSESGCADNYAIFFDTTTCDLEEIPVTSLSEAQSLSSTTKILVDFIACLSTPLSKADPELYLNLRKEQVSQHENCHKPCCYLLDNNTAGCVRVSEFDCTKEMLPQKLNTNAVIVNTLVVGGYTDTCDSANCFDLPQQANLNTNLGKNHGACCINNNNCINISDVNASDLDLYVKNVLKINNIDLNNIAFNAGIISAKDLCSALHGNFMGYNTSCNPNICLKHRIIVT